MIRYANFYLNDIDYRLIQSTFFMVLSLSFLAATLW